MWSEADGEKIDKERQYASDILSRSPYVAFIWKNAEGWPVEYVSDNVHIIFGWHKDDFLAGRIPYVQVVHPDDLSRVVEEVRHFSADKTASKVLHMPYRIVARDGSVKWVEDLTTILRGEDGSVAAYEGIIVDITERKQAETEHKHLQANLINALEIADLGPWEKDFVNDVFTFNDHFYKIYRTTVEQVGGYTMSSEEYNRRFIHPEDVSSVRAEIQRLSKEIGTHSAHQLEHRTLFPDGSTGYVAVRVFFIKDETGKLVKSYGVTQDITGRKLAERERLANLRYFESMEKVNQAIQGGGNDLEQIMGSVLDVCLSVFNCDRAFLLYPCDPDAPSWSVPMERTRPEYPGRHTSRKLTPMDADFAESLRISLSVSGPVSSSPGSPHPPLTDSWNKHGVRSQMIMAIHPKVGKPWLFGLHHCADAHVWTGEEKRLFEKIAQRLSDSLTSLLMYRDLRKNEEFLDRILENIPNAISVKDAKELRYLRINRACEKLLGFSREELIGKNSFDLAPKDQAILYDASNREVVDGKVLVDIPEENIRDKKGEPRILHTRKIPMLDETGKPQHLLVISEDITELKKLQAQLVQAQKMEALGAMSGGIAHDFNNLLQPMLGYSEFLMADLPPDSPQHTFVEGIFNAGLRAKDLVNQILTFSRRSDRQMIPVMLPLILKEAVNLCRSIIPANIDICRDIQKDCALVLADPTQLHQIIMNLMINAYHAMEQTGGEISVRLKETQLREDDLGGIPLPPGKYARLSVTDTGCGMAPAVLEKIFEPYFTTKARGKGTGLGLSVVYGIVKAHGGHIHAYGEEGKGTTFNVYLPLTEKTSETFPAEKMETHPAAGHEHILLVDDEETIVELESQVLERFGYRVTSSRNGAEALALFRASSGAFDLVISDMNMPGMTGDRLAGELLAIRPDIPIIICTGFSERIDSDEAKSLGIKEFLMKPITVSEMTEKVRKVLDEATVMPRPFP